MALESTMAEASTQQPIDPQQLVAQQYEAWPYPEPIDDLEAYYAGGMIEEAAPKILHWLYWPNGWYHHQNGKIDVLVAGCGANLAAKFAYTHPNANVIGIDLSEASLAHEEKLKVKHNLTNLSLHQLPLEDIEQLGQTFDYMDCSGVIHHLPDPVAGLQALKTALRPHGVMHILIYGLYGRMGLYMLQEAFRLLQLQQTQADVTWVQQLLQSLTGHHPIQPFLKDNLDLNYPAGIVDLFLHRLDQGFRVVDCLGLVQESGLQFQGWLDPAFYNPSSLLNRPELVHRVRQLPSVERWQTMELLNGGIRKHSFFVCHPERPIEDYVIDFGSPQLLNMIPIRRAHQFIPSQKANTETPAQPAWLLRHPQQPIPLSPEQEQLYAQVNNSHSIKQCIKESGIQKASDHLEAYTRQFFAELWDLGLIQFYNPA